MSFETYKKEMQNHFAKMTETTLRLFIVDTDPEEMWDTYLEGFPEKFNPIFRKKREHDCSCCRHFIKRFGNVVMIDEHFEMVSIWDFEPSNEKFQQVTGLMSDLIHSRFIKDAFITQEKAFVVDKNRELTGDDGQTIITWEHFYLEVPDRFRNTQGRDTDNSIMSQLRANKEVLQRSFDEISLDAVDTVLELIGQNSLYKGDEWKELLLQFRNALHVYDTKIADRNKDNYCWAISTITGAVMSKIRNHSIGVLLTDISGNEDLDKAVKRYDNIVAPHNYKRPNPIYSNKMVEKAKQVLDERGLLPSIYRRHATIEDIHINNVLYADRDAVKRMRGDVFDEMANPGTVNIKKLLSKIEDVPIQTFIDEVIPGATKIEALFANPLIPNLVSLIAPVNKDAISLFKWNNPFSWAYKGNITDSSIRQNVKKAGGNVEGVLRFSIQWNHQLGEHNDNDYDAHCFEPTSHAPGRHIYFRNKGVVHPSSGMLDVDIQLPDKGVPAVENIVYTDFRKMPAGDYVFQVHNYCLRSGRSGFDAEIAFNGETYEFSYKQGLRDDQIVAVAVVRHDGNGNFELVKDSRCLNPENTSRGVWGIDTVQFHEVSAIMYSPNYWNSESGIGHKHYFFMLKNCVNGDEPNGFFNEFLMQDLMEYRKFFEALGAKMKVEFVENQLSGLGFSSTKRNSLVCRVEGAFNRTINIVF